MEQHAQCQLGKLKSSSCFPDSLSSQVVSRNLSSPSPLQTKHAIKQGAEIQKSKAKFYFKGKVMNIYAPWSVRTSREAMYFHFHIISLNLFFSSSLPNMVSMAPRARSQVCFLSSPKCSAISAYSFERLLPKTPTSSVCFHQHTGKILLELG
jgi:hypothetical protein